MSNGNLPTSSPPSTIDKPSSNLSVTCEGKERHGENEIRSDEDDEEEEEGQTFYSVASNQSSSPENSTRTQVKYLEKESNQLSSSPTSGSSLNTSSSALSSYDNSPQNPGFLYSFLFPSVVRRKSSCEKVKRRRASSLRKVSIKDTAETFLLDSNESGEMSQEVKDTEINESQEELNSVGPNYAMSSRKASCCSRKSIGCTEVAAPNHSRGGSIDGDFERPRVDSGSSIGSWRKNSTHSVDERRDCAKIKGQARRKISEATNYEADNEVRH